MDRKVENQKRCKNRNQGTSGHLGSRKQSACLSWMLRPEQMQSFSILEAMHLRFRPWGRDTGWHSLGLVPNLQAREGRTLWTSRSHEEREWKPGDCPKQPGWGVVRVWSMGRGVFIPQCSPKSIQLVLETAWKRMTYPDSGECSLVKRIF